MFVFLYSTGTKPQSTMKTNEREIQLYYNPHSPSDRQTVAHAQSMASHVKTFSYSQTPSSTTSWRHILKSLDVHPRELLDKSHPYYQEHIRGRDFTMTGWLDIVRRSPFLLKAPIAIRGNRAVVCKQPTDIYRLTQPILARPA